MNHPNGRNVRPADPPLPRTFYSVREISKSIGLSYETVLGLVKAGQIRSIRPGRQYLIPAAELKALQAAAS
ncbi:MAG: excisionase family DNA-binding protein [Pseudonocardia sp.]|nr:excisionase family DNA-binding protein [Pseudonocardia sp.]